MKAYLKQIRIVSFLLLEIILYIAFIFIDIVLTENNYLSVGIKFIGILICFLFVLSLGCFPLKNRTYLLGNKTDGYIMGVALAFTVLSDYFILVRNIYIPGVITFIIVQMLYLVRLSLWERGNNENKSTTKIPFFVLPNIALWMGVLLLLCVLSIQLELLFILAAFYFISIIRNTRKAIGLAISEQSSASVLFAIGMVLFLLCDINVGIFNASDFIPLSFPIYERLYEFSVVGMWLFYLPSQVLIALSCDRQK